MGFLMKPIVLFVLYSLAITSMASHHARNDSVLSQEKPSDNADGLKLKETVVIINDLGGGMWLEFHCKSKNNDLGYKILRPNQSWSFRFEPNFWGTTLFFCRFWWKGESHWFDIYKDSRDNVFGHDRCTECSWKVRKTGPCRFTVKTNNFDLCHNWNKP